MQPALAIHCGTCMDILFQLANTGLSVMDREHRHQVLPLRKGKSSLITNPAFTATKSLWPDVT